MTREIITEAIHKLEAEIEELRLARRELDRKQASCAHPRQLPAWGHQGTVCTDCRTLILRRS